MDTAELAALDQLKKILLENYSKYFDDFLSGERSLPFGLLLLYGKGAKRHICLHSSIHLFPILKLIFGVHEPIIQMPSLMKFPV